jgi:hypothetical protein
MRRTKVLVQRRGKELFVDNIKVEFERWDRRRNYRPPLYWRSADLLNLSTRCGWVHACKTCRREFLGAPAARYCSPECRKPAQQATAARQQAKRVELRRWSIEHEGLSCRTCGKPLTDRRRARWDRPNYCSDACRQRSYRQRRTEAAALTDPAAK